MKLRLLFIFLTLFPLPGLHAEARPELATWDGHSPDLDLLPFLSFAKVSSQERTTPERWLHDASMKPLVEQPSLDFGYSQDTFWFRCRVLNSLDTAQHLVVGSIRPEHSHFTVHIQRQSGAWESFATGSTVPIHERPFYSRLAFAPMNLAPHEEITVLFELRSHQTLSQQFQLMTQQKAMHAEKIDDVTCFFYFGAITLLVLYSLFLGYSLRQGAYFYYALFGFSIAFTTFVYSGFFEVLELHLPLIDGSADTPRILLIPTILAGLYCDRFFRLRLVAPKLAVISSATLIASVFAVALNLSPWGVRFRFLIPIFQLSNFINIFAMTFVGLKERIPGARYQTAGWVVLFVSNCIWIMGNQGVLEKRYFVGFSVLIGNIFEMLMGAIALGAYMRDLERRKFDAELKQKESQNLRTMVFVVCHDIANPLTVIQGAVPIMRPFLESSPKGLLWLEKVEHAGDIIGSIIKQVRRMESIRSGKYHPQLESVPIKFLFDEIDFIFSERAAQKDVKLQLELSDLPEDLAVIGEQTSLLNDVLNNFVSNALKFSNHGDVITISASYDEEQVHIKVRDQGIGMPQSLINKLFEAGAATSRKGTDNEPGTGFGMPLAMYFVQHYNGKISVHSVEKKEGITEPHGTTITTTLPRSYR